MKVAHRARMRAKLSMAPGTRLKVRLGEVFSNWGVARHDVIYRGRGFLQVTGRGEMEFRRQMAIERERTIADAQARGCEVHEYQDELTLIEPAGIDLPAALAKVMNVVPAWATPAEGEWPPTRYQK